MSAETLRTEVPTDIWDGLAEVYVDEGVAIWLTNAHRWLNGERAIDLIRRGDLALVRAAVERLVGGAY